VISVVMPVLNGADTIESQLSALAAQTFGGRWEMIVADNGSTDQTRRVANAWADRLPGFRLVDASAVPGAGGARNIGVAASHGDLLVFCDADDIVSPRWLEAFAESREHWDIAAGVFDYVSLNVPGAAPGVPLPGPPPASLAGGWLPFAGGASLAVRRAAFDAVGGFAPEFLRCQDVELSWRLQLAGFRFAVVAEAVVARRARATLRGLWSQHNQWGRTNVSLWVRYREQGMPRSSVLEALRTYAWLLSRLPACRDDAARREWARLAGVRWGRLSGSLRERTLCI
jgi:GT2 family glycosyltransferase